MAYIAGDINEISIAHPTLGSRTFVCKAGESSTLNDGGIESEDDDAGLATDGQMIDKLTRKRWSAEATIAGNGADQKWLRSVAASPVASDITVDHISGDVYSGKGKPVGQIPLDLGAATIALKLSGGGQMTTL